MLRGERNPAHREYGMGFLIAGVSCIGKTLMEAIR